MPAGGATQEQQHVYEHLESWLTKQGYKYDTARIAYWVRMIMVGSVTIQQAVVQMVKSGDAWQPKNQGGNNNGGQGPGQFPNDPNAGSGGSGGSSSGGSSGGSAPAPPDYAQFIAEYRQQLRSWGIGIDQNLQKLMENAAHDNSGGRYTPWTLTQFMQAVRKTKEYDQAFTGIKNFSDMTEEEYIAQKKAYQSIADTNHVDINSEKIKYLFRNGVSQAEFQDRTQAYSTLQTNKAYFEQFKNEVKAMGGKAPSDKALFKWILSKGESNKEWVKLWDAAQVRYQATQGGFQVSNRGFKGGDLGLTDQDVQSIAKKVNAPGYNQQGSLDHLADVLSQVMPESRNGDWGLTKQDLIEAEFGGSRAASARQKIKDLVEYMNNRASSTYGATQTQAGQRGLASQQRAQSL